MSSSSPLLSSSSPQSKRSCSCVLQERIEEIVHRRDFFDGRYYWSWSLKEDVWFLLKNRHQLLSIFYSHKQNPTSRTVRFFVCISALCFSFMLSSFITLIFGCNQVS